MLRVKVNSIEILQREELHALSLYMHVWQLVLQGQQAFVA